MAEVPPRLHVVQVRPPRIALGLPLERSARGPVAPQLVDIFRASRQFGTYPARSRVEQCECGVSEAAVVVPERHEDVSRIATDVDVLECAIERQPVERKMGLDEAAMFLLFESG